MVAAFASLSPRRDGSYDYRFSIVRVTKYVRPENSVLTRPTPHPRPPIRRPSILRSYSREIIFVCKKPHDGRSPGPFCVLFPLRLRRGNPTLGARIFARFIHVFSAVPGFKFFFLNLSKYNIVYDY